MALPLKMSVNWTQTDRQTESCACSSLSVQSGGHKRVCVVVPRDFHRDFKLLNPPFSAGFFFVFLNKQTNKQQNCSRVFQPNTVQPLCCCFGEIIKLTDIPNLWIRRSIVVLVKLTQTTRARRSTTLEMYSVLK